jgi:CDP-diacylglycerol--serine O-phosphatidyltransferase
MKIKSLIPNVLTFFNLFLGFSAIYFSFRGIFDLAAMAIMLATVFDMLDGRIARILNVHSDIGKELDSFSDLITFGMAPSFLFLNIVLTTGEIPPLLTVFIAFIYLITATLRLAYFNVHSSDGPTNIFSGMPSTFAGISIATLFGFDYIPSLVENWFHFSFKLGFPVWAIVAIFLFYSLLMISKFPYPKSSSWVLNFKSPMRILFNILFITLLATAVKFLLLGVVIVYTLYPLLRIRDR